MCATLPDPEVFGGGAEADADAPDGVDEGASRRVEPSADRC